MTRLICVRWLTMFELCVFVVDDKYPHTHTRKQHTWIGRLQELTRKGENIDRPELLEGGVKTRSAGQRGRPEQEKLHAQCRVLGHRSLSGRDEWMVQLHA